MQGKLILALDLGARLGWACGSPGGASPRSGAVILKRHDEPRAIAFANLIAWLNSRLRDEAPHLIVKEKMLPLAAFRNLGSADHTVRMTAGLHGVVEGLCVRYGIACQDVADATVRKHFIGRANAGKRAATKAAVLERARLLKYLPADCEDEDRADALACFDYAAATFGRVSGGKLYLFGEAA